MTDMLIIDGSMGEGGGQIIRSSLALSALTGKAFTIRNIRAGRKKPGLLRQHLTAANAAARICHARIKGAELGSRELSFVPGPIHGGHYEFSIGNAGSTTLVLQTIIMPLLHADRPSQVLIEGGTHNPFAPPFTFIEHVFAPLLNTMGAGVECKLIQPGFFPAGGGRIQVNITPCASLHPLQLLSRGAMRRQRAEIWISALPYAVAQREQKTLMEKLSWKASQIHIREIKNARGPGNVVLAFIESDSLTEVFTGFGQKGIRAEHVAARVAGKVRRYQQEQAVVGEYLADQLLLPMAMAGAGSFITHAPTMHTETNMEVIRRFMDIAIEARPHDAGPNSEALYRVQIGG